MNTRTLALGGRLTHVAQWPTSTFTLIEAQSGGGVVVTDPLWTTSDEGMVLTGWTDHYGNRGQKLILPAGESVFEWTATATVPDAVDEQDPSAEQLAPTDLPDDALTYLWPSRYCQSDLLSADAWRLFGTGPRTLQRALDVSDWVHGHTEYRTGSTRSTWSALDTFTHGYGICRDFAHTFVALCRALNIPARYVSGYLPVMDVTSDSPGSRDFHAWAEVWFRDRWWTIDPRHNVPRKGHVKIGHGRDAADVPLVTTFGNPRLKSMVVTCREVGAGGDAPAHGQAPTLPSGGPGPL